MKKTAKFSAFILFIFLGSLPLTSFSQSRPYSVTGKLLDAETKQPIEYASVAIFKLPDSTLVTGVSTNGQGVFTINNLGNGRYFLRSSFVGYKNGIKQIDNYLCSKALFTFAAMKKFSIIILGIMVMNVIPSFAQFNTIGIVSPRQKVEQVVGSDNSSIHSEIDSDDGDVMDDKDAASDTSLSCLSLSCVSLPLLRIKVNSPFGWRKDPISGKSHTLHNGLDLYARNDNVMAMLPGVVEKTGSESRAGKYVVLRHSSIRVSYCHLSKILVVQGRNVSAGDVIGVTGSTGRSSGEHLHLVTKQNGRVFNPTIMLDFIRETTQLHSNIPKR